MKTRSLIIRIHHFDKNLVNTEVDGQETEKYNKTACCGYDDQHYIQLTRTEKSNRQGEKHCATADLEVREADWKIGIQVLVIITIRAGSSPVSRTKIRTLRRSDFYIVRSIYRTLLPNHPF